MTKVISATVNNDVYTDAGKVILPTRHKTFCILSQLIPKFRVRKDKKNFSKISLHLSKFAIAESPISTNFALVDDVVIVTYFLNVLYHGYTYRTYHFLLIDW